MIERVSFENFKSLRRVDAALGRFTVIVGPNGSGKTSILDGLDYLARVTREALGSFLTGDRDPLSLMTRDASGPMTLALQGRVATDDVEVKLEIHKRSVSTWEATLTQRQGTMTTRSIENPEAREYLPAPLPSGQGEGYVALTRLEEALGGTRKLRLDVERLAASSYSPDEVPRLRVDGEGLASVLADLAGRSPETFQAITDAARKVVPALERIRTRRAKVSVPETQRIVIDGEAIERKVERPYMGEQLMLDFKGARDVPAPLASEGTLLVIGLLTAVYKESRLRLLLLDDIDKALHPSAQEELIKQLRSVLAMDPDLQIVATSHSPYLLDHFAPEEVLVTGLHPDGSTACAPLTAHPDFERWKATTRTGELWSFVGEDWVVARANAEAAPQ